MRVIAVTPRYLYIACAKEVQVVPLNASSSSSSSLAVPTAVPALCVLLSHPKVGADATIVTLCVSHCRTLLIAGYDDKCSTAWDITPLELEGGGGVAGEANGSSLSSSSSIAAHAHIQLKKKPQCIRTASYLAGAASASASTPRRDVVLVADKFGEVHALPYSLQSSVMVTGHSTSVLTDMAVLPAPAPATGAAGESPALHSLLVTSDRDEKIRVSHFPHVHTIQSYCLHHSNVVSCVVGCRVGGGGGLVVVSAGWDRLLCVWDPASGELLGSCDVTDHVGAIIQEAEEGERAEEEEEEEEGADMPVEGKQGGGEGEGEGDEDGDAGKTYDEQSAGSFPTYICPVELHGEAYIVVAYRQSGRINVYKLQQAAGRGVGIQLMCGYELPCEPCDVLVAPSGPLGTAGTAGTASIVVLLPGPLFLTEIAFDPSARVPLSLVEIEQSSASHTETSTSTGRLVSAHGLAAFRSLCGERGWTFAPTHAGSDSEAAHEHGKGSAYGKHKLVTPFTKMGAEGAALLKKSDHNSSVRKRRRENKAINRANKARGVERRKRQEGEAEGEEGE